MHFNSFHIPPFWCNWCNWCKYPSLMRARKEACIHFSNDTGLHGFSIPLNHETQYR